MDEFRQSTLLVGKLASIGWCCVLFLSSGFDSCWGSEVAPGFVQLTDPAGMYSANFPTFEQTQAPVVTEPETAQPPFIESWEDSEALDDAGPELRLQKLHDLLEDNVATKTVIQYIGQYYVNAHGGLSTNHGRYRGDFDIWTYTDTGKAGWWENGTIGLYFQATHGQTLTREETGDYMFYSLLETFPRRNDVNQLGEAWYEHSFFDEQLTVRVGKLDGYLYLAYQEMSDGFLNTAFTLIPPTPLPSWPLQVLGVYSKYISESGVELRLASYESKDVGPQYFLLSTGDRGIITFGELIVPWKTFGDDTEGSTRFGMWYDTQDFSEISGGPGRVLNGNYGIYLGTQRMLFEESGCGSNAPGDCSTSGQLHRCDEEDDEADDELVQGLYAFVQYGWAPSDRNPLFQFYGGGIAYRGLIPRRDDDLIGLGFGRGNFGDESYQLNGSTYEAVIECFYRWQTRKSLYIQPNLQYIANTGGNGRDSFPIGLQFIQKL